MKKLFTSKPFIGSALAFLSIAIVAVCIFVGQEKKPEFVPEPSSQSESVNDWVESSGGTTPASGKAPVNSPTQEEYPKVAEDDGENVVIDFTPPQSSAEAQASEPPEIPEGKTEIKDPGPSHPVNEDQTVKAPDPEPAAPSGPVPGSTNDKGQVYDPAFGWVTLSPVEQIPTDNDGDINKQVGTMD